MIIFEIRIMSTNIEFWSTGIMITTYKSHWITILKKFKKNNLTALSPSALDSETSTENIALKLFQEFSQQIGPAANLFRNLNYPQKFEYSKKIS